MSRSLKKRDLRRATRISYMICTTVAVYETDGEIKPRVTLLFVVWILQRDGTRPGRAAASRHFVVIAVRTFREYKREYPSVHRSFKFARFTRPSYEHREGRVGESDSRANETGGPLYTTDDGVTLMKRLPAITKTSSAGSSGKRLPADGCNK